MGTELTVSEMYHHMRRQFDEWYLTGVIQPAWAKGWTPVRVGTELGWHHARAKEHIVSSDKLYTLGFLYPYRFSRPEDVLLVEKGTPMRWNKITEEKEYLFQDCWRGREATAVAIADAALGRRALKALSNDPVIQEALSIQVVVSDTVNAFFYARHAKGSKMR